MTLARPALAIAMGTALVLAGSAGAAVKKPKTPACVSFADPAGDTGIAGAPVSDPSVDITKTAFTIKDKVLTAKIDVTKYADASSYSNGVRFDAGFTAPSGKLVTIFGQHSRAEAALSMALAFTGIRVAGTYVTGTNQQVTIAANGNTVLLTVAVADLEAALGGEKLTGNKLTDLTSVAWGNYEAVALRYDDATGATPVTVGTCA